MVLNYFSMENDRTPYSNQTISDQSLKNTKKMCKLVNRVFISEVLNIIYFDFEVVIFVLCSMKRHYFQILF